MSNFVASLNPALFWDVLISSLNDETNKRFIIQRVLERGNRNDWLLTKKRYSLPVIIKEAQSMRQLDPKALSYIACIGNVPLESFKCYTKKY